MSLFQNKQILVLGIAKSGFAVSKLLVEMGALIVVNDREPLEPGGLGEQLIQSGVQVISGEHPLSLFDTYNFEFVVKNPGIPYTNVMVKEALNRGLKVLTEVEIAYLISPAPFIGITGSNGKTTTTTLIHEMLKADSFKPLIAGNIGEVACQVVQEATEEHVIVTELSSFQLLGIHQFRPKVSVLLNIFDAHLDYHGTKDEYVGAKFNIFSNQTASDYAVVNLDDPIIRSKRSQIQSKIIPFSTKSIQDEGAYLKGSELYFRNEKIINLEEIVLPGAHNLENILAAIATVKLWGVSNTAIHYVLTTFTGVMHRLQFVKEVKGRKFYNDSKATNILATKKAITSFKDPLVLIAGGLDRGNTFDALIEELKNVKILICYGQTAHKIKDAAKAANVKEIYIKETLSESVEQAYASSKEGDIVLLSPACASWDQFKTFEERGCMFVQQVNKLV